MVYNVFMAIAKVYSADIKSSKIRKKPLVKHNPSEPMKVNQYNFTVIFTPAEEGGYVVMAQDAIAGYIEVLLKDGQPIPEDNRFRTEQIGIHVPVFA